MTPSLEGLPPKAKESPPPMRLTSPRQTSTWYFIVSGRACRYYTLLKGDLEVVVTKGNLIVPRRNSTTGCILTSYPGHYYYYTQDIINIPRTLLLLLLILLLMSYPGHYYYYYYTQDITQDIIIIIIIPRILLLLLLLLLLERIGLAYTRDLFHPIQFGFAVHTSLGQIG